MTQPTERRFVMEPRLDAEIQTINDALATKITNPAGEANIASNAITNTKIADGAVTSAKIANGTIVDADVNSAAAIAATKVQGTVPTGGGAGQVLAKSSTTDYATTWVDGTALPASQVKQLVKNMTGSAIPKGSVVYFSGADGTNILISLSDADTEATSSKTVGFTESDIANAGTGYVVSEGLISNVDTGSATAGQSVWLSSTAGGYVFGAPPAKPAHSVYLGLVTRANANTGEIFVKVQNGFELEELHNVSINSGTLATGQALTYDAATSLWKNSTPVNALSGLSDVTLTAPLLAGQVIKYDTVTSKWVNGTGGGGGATVISQDTAPNIAAAAEDALWYNTATGTLFICFIDADATKQWVEVQANSALGASLDVRVSTLETAGAGVIKLNPQTLNSNYTMPSGFNGMSAGPITIADGVVVTIPDGGAWSIV